MTSHQNKKYSSGLSIVDAVEALSNIADIEFDKEIGVANAHDLEIQDQRVTYRTIHWLDGENPEEAVRLIEETFRTILRYLQHFYENEYRHMGNKKTIEGVKAIMVLVGEAAKKLDKYTTLFQKKQEKSVTELPEYIRLHQFYHRKIAKKVDQGLLGKWILGLTRDAMERKEAAREEGGKTTNTRHIFIDLESVKKDTEYELFYIRKEDGARFFNPRLIRNVKLVSDFGERFQSKKVEDPIDDLKLWQDTLFCESANEVIESLRETMNRYWEAMKKEHARELTRTLDKALMSLILSSKERNLLKHCPAKSCGEYFQDFLSFMREALHARDYERMMVYPSARKGKVAHALLDLVHGLCEAVFTRLHPYRMILPKIEHLVEEAEEGGKKKER